MGVGEAIADKNCWITQQQTQQQSRSKPLITKARKSVAGFKIRQGYPIGCKVTLRGERMWEFFERLITIAVPRIRDFRGLSAKSFDGRGNYSMGVREQIIFPEIDYDKVDRVRGLILPLPLLRNLTKKAALCWLPLTSRSASKVGLLNG